jgi:Protein of unknown function (DUF2569)
MEPSANVSPVSKTQGTDPGNPDPAVKPAPSGIGGWLILMAIGQVLGPLRFFTSVIQYYSSFGGGEFRQFPVTFVGEAFINCCLAILYVYTAVLFFRTSKRFPRFFVYEVVASVSLFFVNAFWVAATLSMSSGQAMGPILQRVLEPREIGQTIAAAIVGGIWIAYVFNSRRVANTFVA